MDAGRPTDCLWSTRDTPVGFNLYWERSDGSGEVQRLTDSKNSQYPASWHPSGKFLVFVELSQQTGNDLMILPMEGDEASGWRPGKPTVFLNSPFTETYPMFSPDGRWLAYASDESGRNEVYVGPFLAQVGSGNLDLARALRAAGLSSFNQCGREPGTSCSTRRLTTGSWSCRTPWKVTCSAPTSRDSGRRRLSCGVPDKSVSTCTRTATGSLCDGSASARQGQAGQGRLDLQLLRRAAPDRADKTVT